jgi:hypothetical protein
MIVPWQPALGAAQTAGKIEVLGRKPAAMDEAETGSADRRPDLGHAPGCAPVPVGKSRRAWRGSVQILNS